MRHGTIHAYKNLKCRCDKCRHAHRAYEAKRRSERFQSPIPPSVKHGLYATYVNWGCRCHDCCDAASTYNARYHAKLKRKRAKT